MQETCPRCDATLPVVDGEVAMFCASCGLPQLRVSAELLEAANESASTQVPPSSSAAGQMDWPLMLRLCAIGSAAGILLSMFLPGAITSGAGGPLSLFLLPLLTLGIGLLYVKQRPLQRMSPGLGARMGSVIALFLMAGTTMLSAAAGFFLRYHSHSRVVEQGVEVQMAQFEAQMHGMAAGPATDALLLAMKAPEWRAGMFLWIQVFAAFLLLVAGCLFGALAGAVLSARQRRNLPAD